MTIGIPPSIKHVLMRGVQSTHRHLRLAGLFTWLVAGLPTLYDAIAGPSPPANFIAWLGCWLLFGGVFWFASSPERVRGPRAAIAVLAMIALLGFAAHPNNLGLVLLVVVAALAGKRLSLVAATIGAVAQTTAAAALMYRAEWSVRTILSVAVAYFAFQLFAIFVSQIAASEERARQELSLANVDLTAVNELISISSRMGERVRLARDLHDLLGHHLTALSVNLQLVEQLTAGQAREHTVHALALTKLLLSDVRAVVSDLREEHAIDLATMLRRVVDAVPAPAVELSLDERVRVTEPAIAQAVVRCVQEVTTNAMRHSDASRLELRVRRESTGIVIVASDDGRGTDRVRIGNGLRGIEERVAQLGGSLEVQSTAGEGFNVRIAIPFEEVQP